MSEGSMRGDDARRAARGAPRAPLLILVGILFFLGVVALVPLILGPFAAGVDAQGAANAVDLDHGDAAMQAAGATPAAGADSLAGATVALYAADRCDAPLPVPQRELGSLAHRQLVQGDAAATPTGVVPTELPITNVGEAWVVDHDLAFDPAALFDGNHVLAVRQRPDAGGRLVVCGVLGGVLTPETAPIDRAFYISLAPVGNAPFRGYAIFGLAGEDEPLGPPRGVEVALFAARGSLSATPIP